MKKLALALALLAPMFIAACGGNNEDQLVVPETEEQAKSAVEVVMYHDIANVSGERALVPGVESSLSGDENNSVTLTIREEVKVKGLGKVGVDIKWSYDATKYKGIITSIANKKDDDMHKIMYFEYSETEVLTAEFKAQYQVELKDGSVYKQDEDAFKVKLNKVNRLYEEHTIKSLYTPNEAGRYCFMKEDGTIGSNKNKDGYDQRFYFVGVRGKLVYLAADKNFGILSDGDLSVYLYKINELSQAPEVGKYYYVGAEVGTYNGSLQLTFIKKMIELSADEVAAAKIEEPSAAHAMTVEQIMAASQISDKHMYLSELSGLTYEGGVTSSTDASKRFTFDVKQGDKTLTVAYDYHTKIGTDLVAKLKDVQKGATITKLVGRMVYADENSGNKFVAGGHSWQLLILSADDIVLG